MGDDADQQTNPQHGQGRIQSQAQWISMGDTFKHRSLSGECLYVVLPRGRGDIQKPRHFIKNQHPNLKDQGNHKDQSAPDQPVGDLLRPTAQFVHGKGVLYLLQQCPKGTPDPFGAFQHPKKHCPWVRWMRLCNRCCRLCGGRAGFGLGDDNTASLALLCLGLLVAAIGTRRHHVWRPVWGLRPMGWGRIPIQGGWLRHYLLKRAGGAGMAKKMPKALGRH